MSLFDEQLELEQKCISLGLEKLRQNTERLEDQQYASASVYGVALISELMQPSVDQFKASRVRLRRLKIGVHAEVVLKYLEQIEDMALAAITLKKLFDGVFTKQENTCTEICVNIGRAIQAECQFRFYQEMNPGLKHTIEKSYFHRAKGTEQKFTVMRTMMNRNEIKWKGWGNIVCAKLGAYCLDTVCEATGAFQRLPVTKGRKTIMRLFPSFDFWEKQQDILDAAAKFSGLRWPMLIPPKPWSNEEKGGYLLNDLMNGQELVRRGNPRLKQGEEPIRCLNHIQNVGWRLSPEMVELSQTLYDRQIKVDKFVPIVILDLPPKPPDIATNEEARKSYNRRSAQVRDTNAQAFRKAVRTRMTLEAVRYFKDKTFYSVFSLGYRGRMYPVNSVLSIQDTDWGKSLLRFADEAPVTPEAIGWLEYQVGNTYGLDKEPIHVRKKFAQDNHELISAIAQDPAGTVHLWESTDSPFCFVAACIEYWHICIRRDRHTTGLPVAADASCSGLQILSSCSADADTAHQVNVTPSDKPQDAYKVVAEACKPFVPESIKPFMNRRTLKRTIMTIPYNSQTHSNRKYIRDELKTQGCEFTEEELTETVKVVRQKMADTFPGPIAVMAWINSEVAKAMKRGVTELSWTTPSGFVVHQKLNKYNFEVLDLQLLGRCTMRVATEPGDEVDKKHHKLATSPNYVHSLDASVLVKTTLAFGKPIGLIHDSVLARATDMDELSVVVREQFAEMFSGPNLLEEWGRQIGAETPPPVIGNLDPNLVKQSTYFFS
jgi:DNA-directed RNA polymerase